MQHIHRRPHPGRMRASCSTAWLAMMRTKRKT
jgi:hypothetical protein